MISYFAVSPNQDITTLAPRERNVVKQILGVYALLHTDDYYGFAKANKPIQQHSVHHFSLLNPAWKPDDDLAVMFDVDQNYDSIERLLLYEHRNDAFMTRPQMQMRIPGNEPITLYAEKMQGQYVLNANGSTDILNAQHDAYADAKRSSRMQRRDELLETLANRITHFPNVLLSKAIPRSVNMR